MISACIFITANETWDLMWMGSPIQNTCLTYCAYYIQGQIHSYIRSQAVGNFAHYIVFVKKKLCGLKLYSSFHFNRERLVLINLHQMEFPTLIKLTNLFRILGLLGSKNQFHSTSKSIFWKQIVQKCSAASDLFLHCLSMSGIKTLDLNGLILTQTCFTPYIYINKFICSFAEIMF